MNAVSRFYLAPAAVSAEIAAHRAALAQLRAQRAFRQLGAKNVVSLAARRLAKFPLVGSL